MSFTPFAFSKTDPVRAPNVVSFLFWGCLAAALWSSCDQLDDPIIDIIPPCESEDAPVFESLSSATQGVLLEDFTAHQCGNCPPAATEAGILASAHPGIVIPLAIHAGDLASTNEEYPNDWTCAESDVFWGDLQFQVNPAGRINRQEDETAIFFQDEWEEKINEQLALVPTAGLQMEVQYNPEDGKTAVHVHTTWFDDQPGPVRLALLVAESELFGPQLWYGNNPEYVEVYEFEHLLRGSVTGAKGLVVADSPNAGDADQFCYAFDWNDSWDANHSEVIAVLTRDNGSVIQVLSAHVAE